MWPYLTSGGWGSVILSCAQRDKNHTTCGSVLMLPTKYIFKIEWTSLFIFFKK